MAQNKYNFPVIIDGEVVMCLTFSENIENAEKLAAIWGSNPTVMQWNEYVPEGSTWNGTSFTAPE